MEKTLKIVIAEDNPADIVLLREALSGTGYKFRMHVFNDGMETHEFLLSKDANAVKMLPDMIVLDNNMPRKTGLELLTEIKGEPSLSGIPVIILSGSEKERGIFESIGLPSERYIVKPVTYSGYGEVAQQIIGIWLKTRKA